jgi:antitoxin (DNA-binding transcriptional repressor) of toxin-antitoxin stability system
MTIQVNVYEAKTNFSKLLERVQAGERVIISKNGRPVADLVHHQGSTVRFGGLSAEIRYDEDEFNAADAEIAAMFDPDLDLKVANAPA